MKSAEVRLNEVLEHLKKTSPTQYKLVSETLPSMIGAGIEAQASFAEKAANIKEAQRTVRKYNGDEHNGLITESSSEGYAQGTTKTFSETDKVMYDFMESRGEITSDQKRKALNQPPAEYANFNEAQRKEFNFARSVGISEADALRLIAITSGRRL